MRPVVAVLRVGLLWIALSCSAHAQEAVPKSFMPFQVTVVAGQKVGYALYERPGDRSGSKPLVVLIGGSEGGYGMARSPVFDQLFDRGYNVVSLAYFGFDKGPRHLSLIDVDAIHEAIQSLARRLQGPDTCIGVLGVSKGGELALVLAAFKDTADAYVAAVPSSVAWQASNVTLSVRSSWMIDGQPVAFVRYPWLSVDTIKGALDTQDALEMHKSALRDDNAAERAAIPVELSDAPIFLQSATFDHVWPSAEMSAAILERVNIKNPGHKVIHREYAVDHFILRDQRAAADAIQFLDDSLIDQCGSRGP